MLTAMERVGVFFRVAYSVIKAGQKDGVLFTSSDALQVRQKRWTVKSVRRSSAIYSRLGFWKSFQFIDWIVVAILKTSQENKGCVRRWSCQMTDGFNHNVCNSHEGKQGLGSQHHSKSHQGFQRLYFFQIQESHKVRPWMENWTLHDHRLGDFVGRQVVYESSARRRAPM